MTTINTSTLSAYSSSLSVTVKNQEAQAANAAATQDDEKKTTEVSLEGAKVAGTAEGGTVGGSSSSALESTIDKIKEQIKQAQKQLAQQQAQLAAAQSSQGTPEEKAQRAMAIQAQIMATSASLQTLQGTLLQLQTQGGVNTKA
ncbi:hypothetical protein BZK31_11860 [Pseudomonas floridensis]|uniref:Uncharacterized protein n=1 Tax=Pseudomonas floridensis TaxID=1958950 RepID=A0A1X0N648_9PSED|nr:hypothetical protein [Pseudomonas floridensis]ORC59053.1 hypothetical protein BZK31_11860 [Pseudomonas floridensis]